VQEGGPIFLPKGTDVIIPIQIIQRDPTCWAWPNAFDPARFLDDAVLADKLNLRRMSAEDLDVSDPSDKTSAPDGLALPGVGRFPSRFRYFPFSMGPRACIGSNLALLEARVLLTVMLRDLEWTLNGAGYKHAPVHIVTVRPRDGVPVFLRLRRK
jgi:cytochrome P450